MTTVLSMATFLGLVGTVASFILFFIGVNVLHLSKDVLQSMIPQAFRRGAFSYIYNQDKRPFLVLQAEQYTAGSGSWHSDSGDHYRSLWPAHTSYRLEPCFIRMGLRHGFLRFDGPCQGLPVQTV